MEIRRARTEDFDRIWPIFKEVVSRGDAYAFSPETDRAAAHQIWMEIPAATYVAISEGKIVGTYYIKPNQPGLGSHVCNAGFMVASDARGQGIGRSLGRHAIAEAVRLGFRAMQFNFVVSTNEPAVKLWKSLGFAIAGTLPKAFRHSTLGWVDVYVMYQWLGD
ncbi:GNAT family N-acetyltransferase [Lyngbya sp. CCY1209]|uniref:GNAT family N-acetyltransferase n=1 Tax=Lyngbya sp. CCY1209 TaxID=2886103 RepID=UPI002D2157E3|nr:GNAT family N-acetyltransferase [Lyngbya sp. CCY1209]MEB3886667.1 GNAT family N-acetyltransferase [Lyngbya sp. CCY1209]